MPSRKRLLQLALEEKAKRHSIPALLDLCFQQQRDFIKDPSKRKCAFVARRSGKSFALGVYMLKEALTHARVKVLYIGLSKTSAENVMWTHTIEDICLHYKIPHSYNHTTKTVSFDNGSIIRLTGADASPQQMHQLLGGKYFMAVVDECQSYSQNLQELIDTHLGAAVSDYIKQGGGVICMAGTPGNHMGDHYWYRCTKTEGIREPGWSVHHWKQADNPHMKEEILEQLKDFDARLGPSYQETTWFKQQFLCQWVVDDIAKVYKFDPVKNLLLEKIPTIELKNTTEARLYQLEQERKVARELRSRSTEYYYILGLDLGWNDDNAWVVGAYHRHNRNFYIVESFSQNKIPISTIAEITKGLSGKYNFRAMVVDTGGGGRLIAESMRAMYQLPLKAADKAGEKEAIISIMNSDFVTENIKVIESTNQQLIQEWNKLVVDRKKQAQGVFKEADKFKNHLADAALYAFREARHYRATPTPDHPGPSSFAANVEQTRKRLKPPVLDSYEEADWQETNRQVIEELIAKRSGNY